MNPEIRGAHPLERADGGLDSPNLRVVDVHIGAARGQPLVGVMSVVGGVNLRNVAWLKKIMMLHI